MKRTQVIRITPCKKKSQGLNQGYKYFNKLAKNSLGYLLSFLNDKEQILAIKLNSKFKAAILSINEINENNSIDWFKYTFTLIKLEDDSKQFSPYLNVYLNINIINTSLKSFGINSENVNKINVLKKIIERNYHERKLKKLLIQINEPEDFSLYYSLLSSIKNEILIKLKFDLDISQSIDTTKNIDIIKKLFSLTTFRNIKPFKPNNKKKLIEIQDYFISNNIKTMHKYLWSNSNAFLEKAQKYFTLYNNCLFGINNIQQIKLIEKNPDSIKYINIAGYAPDEFDVYNKPKFKKIKFDYPSEEFNKILLEKIDFTNLEQISGIIISQENIDLFIKKINSMKKLKKIHRIKFGLTEDEEENEEIKESLFINFFNGIKKSQGGNLVQISTWWKKFKKGKDYEFILNNFPKIRKIQEDYDASGLYDMRFEIDKIFSCNAEAEFKENDLIAITKMVKNFIEQKKEGENSIKFELYNNYASFEQLINFWIKNNENKILEKINYINMPVSDCEKHDKPLGLNLLNAFDFKNDNSSLIKIFDNVKIINQVIINNSESIEKIKDLSVNDKKINSIVVKQNNLNKNELDFLKQIKNLKYLILDDKIINNMNEGKYNFKVIAKKYFANTIDMP